MLEMLVNPREAEKRPSRMFFVGLLYASLSLFLVNWIFLHDIVFAKHAPLLLVTFTMMFSLPFIYYLIRFQEIKRIMSPEISPLREHGKALLALLWLFSGFVVAFSFWYIILPEDITAIDFRTQIEQYCAVNMPSDMQACLAEYGVAGGESKITGHVISGADDVFLIFKNNFFVLIFVLIFNLAFGAGAIFIIAWNAGVIGTAIGLLLESSFSGINVLYGFMLHGIPEIAAYFIAALAGGIISIAVIRHDFDGKRTSSILIEFILLILAAIFILFIAALIEVFITPLFF